MAAQNPTIHDPLRAVENMLDKDAVQEKVAHARERLGAMYERGKERALQWEGNFENYVSERPLRSVLIAAGVGLLLGALISRR